MCEWVCVRGKISLAASLNKKLYFESNPTYPERPGECGDRVLAGGVGGHGVHVADASDSGRAGEADDCAALPVLVLAHVLEGRLDHQVRSFLRGHDMDE